MPTYDYRCNKCGHAFDTMQSIVADPLMNCPRCQRPALKRMISPGLPPIFKGSGFYATDYGKKPVPPRDAR